MRRLGRMALGVAVLAVLVASLAWYALQTRCAAELNAWAQLRAAVIQREAGVFLVDTDATRRYREGTGVTRADAMVRRYCDAPIWEWWF